jgi:glycosyltransferase involved in cell wall biosynthesis
VHVVYVADAPRVGGAERYLADVVAGTVAAGHAATVLAPQDALLEAVGDAAPRARLVRSGADAYAAAPSMGARMRRLLPAAAGMARAVRAAGGDLVHVNNGGYPGSDLCRLVPVLGRRRPAVMTVHSLPWTREHSDPRVQRVVDAALWRSLDAVAGATAIVGDGLEAERGLPPRMYRLLPYGVPAPGGAEEASALRSQLAPHDELLVGMVSATADPGKGHAVLRDAVAMAGTPVRAVMIGADPGAGFDDLTIAARVPSVGPYLHAIDVLAVPSTSWESLPLVILEAMAAGKPVFGSRLAGIPEAVEDGVTGALFPPGDARALARLLEGADRSALAHMGAAGRVVWCRRFSPERMFDGVLGLYRELDSAPR